MYKLLIALLFCVFSLSANAGDLIIMGLSKHFNTDTEHREKNWGLGYHGNVLGFNGISVGIYENSEFKTSLFVLKDFYHKQLTERLSFNVPIGAVTGYSLPVMPVALPVLTYDVSKKVHLDSLVIPPIAHRMGVAAVQARITF